MLRLEEDKVEEESKEESKIIFLDSPGGGTDDPKIRKCMLYGDINEQQAKDLIATMILLADTAETQELEDPEDPESEIKTTIQPFEIVISTGGGNADDMMSIYDMTRLIRQDVDIETTGIGKVMSAGLSLIHI